MNLLKHSTKNVSVEHDNRHAKRSCAECKRLYNKKYRSEGRFLEYERKRYQKIKDTRLNKAKKVVYDAVRCGILPRVKTLKCVDCGDTATCYDHRDYKSPLIVDPVCHGCNRRRGPGLNRD